MLDFIPVLEGKVALVTYVASALSLLLLHASSYSPWLLLLCAFSLFLATLPSTPLRRVATVTLISCGLGAVFGAGLLLPLTGTLPFVGVYLMSLSFFHFSEYLLTSLFHPSTLTIHSFLLDHSLEYSVAAVFSWVEFCIEYWLHPQLKTSHPYVSLLGVAMVMGGEALRKLAMLQAQANFTHTVMTKRRTEHSLVTSGVYGVFRHPSYVGWFCWSVGTQVLLVNPLCLVAYTLASWRFFAERTYSEEMLLIQFFKQDYINYKRRVWSGLPFIRGFPLEEVKDMFPASGLDVGMEK